MYYKWFGKTADFGIIYQTLYKMFRSLTGVAAVRVDLVARRLDEHGRAVAELVEPAALAGPITILSWTGLIWITMDGPSYWPSIRGWAVRTLGPGVYRRVGTSADFVNQSGDIKLELSTEYRAKLFGPVETALFVDAGNIWTIRNYEGQEGGVFRFNSFYNQIALAYGTGIRLNFNYFIIRVDLGVKAFDPSRDGEEKWRILHTVKNDLAVHFAVGYPF